MKLTEQHKEFVVNCFARFMKLTDIVEAFLEKFENEIPIPQLEKMPELDELLAQPLTEEEAEEKREYIDSAIEEYTEEFEEEYGDKADQKLNEIAHEEYQETRESKLTKLQIKLQQEAITDHQERLKTFRQNLFNRFRRLNIDHAQFPNKYRTLFTQTRSEFYANHRSPNLDISMNLSRELETLYGYQKQLIFNEVNPKTAMKYIDLAHQILKTMVAHNAVNPDQGIVETKPPDMKALEGEKP